MLDNQLIQVFLPVIQAGLIADGFSNVIVKQADQPTQQGIPLNSTVFFQKIHDHRYGWGDAEPVWNNILGQEQLTENQWHETTFQVLCLSIQNPLTPNQYTAADLANEVASILQSQATQLSFIAQNVGLLRISQISNPYIQDDRDQFEATPMFDFTLTHLQTRVSTIPVISSEVIETYPE